MSTPTHPPSRAGHFWEDLPQDATGVFRTDPHRSPYWRHLLAFNPVETFTLHTPSQLPDLRQFLVRHQNRLCAGYLSYDLGLQLLNLTTRHLTNLPLAVFHAYSDWQEAHPAALPDRDIHTALHFKPSMDKTLYRTAIEQIHRYIRAGDFYQINLTQQLKGVAATRPRDLYPQLLQNHPAAHACYLETEDATLHSLSPELFLHHKDGRLTTEPIKGTRPRSADSNEDEQNRLALLNSSKEQAELYMITDLLRNDLGKVSSIGSVVLDAMKEIRQLPRVWHTVSRLHGRLRNGLEPFDALLSMFPGGSITGCPKKRAMEVIDELEISGRGIYTGSIGYIHPDGELSFNIAIRTLLQQGEKLRLGTGGGITIDSHWESEWEELLVKASTFT